MLDPDAIDLDELCLARDDRSYEHTWWIHPDTGEIKPHIPDVDGDSSPEDDGWRYIDPGTSHAAYRDMADFVAAVPDRKAADLLDRAITGKGAFRQFKGTLFDFPELREVWFRFHDARATRRALEWLEDSELITPEAAERARARHPDPPPPVVNPLAAAVAADLRELYGERLREVVLFGSRARGDHTEESDLDLLVVLADPVDRWGEIRAMDEILYRHFDRSGIVITVLPVGAARWRAPDEPVLIRASSEGVRVA